MNRTEVAVFAAAGFILLFTVAFWIAFTSVVWHFLAKVW